MNNVYYMIERTIDGRAYWWAAPHWSDWSDHRRWTTRSNEARHYTSKVDAEFVMSQYQGYMVGCEATEHIDLPERNTRRPITKTYEIIKRCEDCSFVQIHPDMVLECRKHAPTTDASHALAVWPQVFDDDWCGDFEMRTDEPIG